MQIIQIPCRKDNYSILIHNNETNFTILFDASEYEPIIKVLYKNNWNLDAILITHYHFDHTAAVINLKRKFNSKVYGPTLNIKNQNYIDYFIDNLKEIYLKNIRIQIIKTPGHTPEQIVFYIKSIKSAIIADTIFSLGCARIINGTTQELYQSINKLKKQLPNDTSLYCGHEYTESNGKFAISIDPNNQNLIKRIFEVKKLRLKNLPTLPTLLKTEKLTNPFLRCNNIKIKKTLSMQNATNEEIFTKLRLLKDNF